MTPPPERPTRVRWAVLASLAGAAIISYLTRASVSPAGTTIQADLRLTDVELGYVLSGFFLGYITLQVPGGWLGGRFGARVTLFAFSLLWSLATLATATAHSFAVLRGARIAMGAAQAGLFAVIIKVIADWFPESRRGTAGAVITGSMSIGAVIASGLTVRLIGPLGWRLTFAAYAAVGVVWAILFVSWFRNLPEEHPAVNAAECVLIRAGRAESRARPLEDAEYAGGATPKGRTPGSVGSLLAVLGSMAVSLGMWALCTTSALRAFGYALFITWFPAYLEHGFRVAPSRAGDLSMMPLAAVVLGSFLGGPIVDGLLQTTGSKWLSRSGLSAGALGLCAAATLSATLVRQPLAAVSLIAVGAMLSGIAGPTTWAVTMDISGRQTALAFAIMNTAGNLGAIACPIAVGYLIDHIRRTGGHWDWVLYLFAGIYLAAGLFWLALDPNRSAVERSSKEASEPP